MSDNSWLPLKSFTPARVALGRSGVSVPTLALLEFELAHAQARDAVYAELDSQRLCGEFEALGFQTTCVESAARNRGEYLRRPEAGRRLAPDQAIPVAGAPELVLVVADGLSAVAANRHAAPLLAVLKPLLSDWRIGPVVLAHRARVAIGDEIGERLGAAFAAVLIGERPGLSASDSLGVYLTFRPKVGRTDAERNCLSNIRPDGLTYEAAAYRLTHLLQSARRLQMTGVALKDTSNSRLLE